MTKGEKGKVKVLKDGKLKIFKAVKGLVRDGKIASKLIKAERPEVVALGLAPEELDGLRTLLDEGGEYEPDLSNIDMAYVEHLAEYGDVEAPPPCFTKSLKAADRLGIDVVALDIDISSHTDIYVQNVLFSDLLRQSMKFRYIKKKKFKIRTAEDFALQWDAILNKAEGFSIVESAREDCMAEALRGLLEKYNNIVAIIEIERSDGVVERLLRPKKTKKGKKRAKKGKK